MKVVFIEEGRADYEYWIKNNVKTLRRINKLINNAKRTPFSGLGKPELLKDNYKGCWSRRIDEEHRLVYRIVNKNELHIMGCRFHYSK